MNTNRVEAIREWFILQWGTVFLTLLRLRNYCAYYLWAQSKVWVAFPLVYLKNNPRYLYNMKRGCVSFLAFAVIGVILWGPIQVYWTEYRDMMQLKKDQKTLELLLNQQKPYHHFLENAFQKVHQILRPGRAVNSRFQMPYHSFVMKSSQNVLSSHERMVSPKDNALYLAALLLMGDKGIGLLAQTAEEEEVLKHNLLWNKHPLGIHLWRVQKCLNALQEFQVREKQYLGLFPNIQMNFKEGLQASLDPISYTNNAWLSWVLAAWSTYLDPVQEEMMTEGKESDPLLEQKTSLKQSVDQILAAQNYSSYLNKEFLLDNVWTEDILPLLWVFMHEPLNEASRTQILQSLDMISVLYPLQSGDYIDMPLTSYGNLDDLAPFAYLLPMINEIKPLLVNAVRVNVDWALQHRKGTFLGSVLSFDGQMIHGGIAQATLVPSLLKTDQMMSLSATAIGHALLKNETMDQWLAKAFADLWPQEMILGEDLSEITLGLLGGLQGWIQKYLDRHGQTSLYERFWKDCFQTYREKKPGQVIYQTENALLPPPLHTFFLKSLLQKSPPSLSLLGVLEFDRHTALQDGELLKVKQKHHFLELQYSLRKPVTLAFRVNPQCVRPWSYDFMKIDYEWESLEDLALSFSLDHHVTPLASSEYLSLREGHLKWKKSSWWRLQWPLQRYEKQSRHLASTVYVTLNPLKLKSWKNAKGRLSFQEWELHRNTDQEKIEPLWQGNFLSESKLSIPESYTVFIKDWQALGLASVSETSIRDNGFILEKEVVAGKTGLAGIALSVEVLGIFDIEEDLEVLSFDISVGSWGDFPPFIKVLASFEEEGIQRSFYWNLALPKQESKNPVYRVVLGMKDAQAFRMLQGFEFWVDSRINQKKSLSFFVNHIRCYNKDQASKIKEGDGFILYDHRDTKVTNMLQALYVQSTKHQRLFSESDMLVFDETVNGTGGIESFFYPEQCFYDETLRFTFPSDNEPDAQFRIKFYHQEILILEKDILVLSVKDKKDFLVKLPQSVYGMTVDRILITHVKGQVRLSGMYLE